MKKIVLLLAAVFIVGTSCAQKSPRKQATGKIGSTQIDIDYGAPSVKGRTIWGDLVKYDKVWRAGANENTTVSFDKNVKVAGNDLAAGKYGFFIIPKEDGKWVVIFSKKNDAWGSKGYSEENDALRITLPIIKADSNQELLQYSVDGNSIIFAWEKAKINIPITE